MRRSALIVLALLALPRFAQPRDASTEPHAPDPESISRAVDASNRFAMDLFQAISDDSDNLLFSPLGVSNTLGVIFSGARGETRAEMARILHLSDRREEACDHDVYSDLLRRIQERAERHDCRLLLRCRLWGPPDRRLHDAYLSRIRERHGTAFSVLAPPGDPEDAAIRTAGSGPVAGETPPEIPSGLSGRARLFLTGAVSYRGARALPFDAGETRRAPFYALERVSPSETRERAVIVPMMRRTGSFGYARREGVEVLEIPAADPNLSILILLPEDAAALHRLQEDLGSSLPDRWWTGLEETELRLSLPRLHLAGAPDLCRALRRMGVRSAFYENTADLSGMAAGERICFGEVRHLCDLVLAEERGERNDAAQAKLLRFGANPDGPPELRVDRPFLLLVRDTESGGILVLGRVMNPAS